MQSLLRDRNLFSEVQSKGNYAIGNIKVKVVGL